jgi:hypothetical protein
LKRGRKLTGYKKEESSNLIFQLKNDHIDQIRTKREASHADILRKIEEN